MVLKAHAIAFRGSAAHSPFRLQRLLQQFAEKYAEALAHRHDMTQPLAPLQDSKTLCLASQHVYLLWSTTPLNHEQCLRAMNLLGAAGAFDRLDRCELSGCTLASADEIKVAAEAGQNYLIVPHHGTISPWSSKATEILRRCGLEQVLRVERATHYRVSLKTEPPKEALTVLFDRMTQDVLGTLDEALQQSFGGAARPLQRVVLGDQPQQALNEANRQLGLSLSADEIDYLVAEYQSLGRDPTDAELMMFAQANSEHCRHKIFRGSWEIDGEAQELSLFDMIRNTHRTTPDGVLSAYSDNAAVFVGGDGQRFQADPENLDYGWVKSPIHVQIKAETHNHPTAISPYPGAATGSGGEIRDEAATGRGARPKAALSGFSVSDLLIPGQTHAWEQDVGRPGHLASALQIMLEGPIGAASYNNEFGRPALCGYFRTLTQLAHGQCWGYHKPIMLAGGYGNIAPEHVLKQPVPVAAKVIVLGGPAMLIGLGGGAASSAQSDAANVALDYASVQRDNPEMQRRCQQVIEQCLARGDANPILSIHDVGAGGLSNAIPELLDADGRGGIIDLNAIPTADTRLSPMELWSNEAQERYVLAVAADAVETLLELCERERCPVAVVGEATADGHFQLQHGDAAQTDDRAPVDLPLSMVLGKTPQMHRQVERWRRPVLVEDQPWCQHDLAISVERVLRLPAVASKQFLITIGDRTIGGLSVRDQMVGPWQVPVADVAVTARDFQGFAGEAMAMGERTPLAVHNAPASGRMAVAEALTNLAAAPIADIRHVKLSANWMAAAGEPGQDADLFDTVHAVGMTLCPELGLGIPVGKDSLSMRVSWQSDQGPSQVSSPVSLIVSAFAPVSDVRHVLTPQLHARGRLLLIDLGAGRQRLGGSALAQVWQRQGGAVPDLEHPLMLRRFFTTIQSLNQQQRLLAYHDRSDGGVLTTLLEMAWAGHCGIQLDLASIENPHAFLFNEELGAVIQVDDAELATVRQAFTDAGLDSCVTELGTVNDSSELCITLDGVPLYREELARLECIWAETSHAIARLRDNAAAVDEEYQRLEDWQRPGLTPRLSFPLIQAPAVLRGRPRVAILREQGVNGHMEMAAAFQRAGFQAVDVHMSDLLAGRQRLLDFQGLVACGGFSYGDVLGAGQGWAKSVLFNTALNEQFAEFFQRLDRFALGVCNGCQMLSTLAPLIPGADHWPRFERNRSEQFEARLSLVEVTPSPSLFLEGMAGSIIPVAVAHGEGRAVFAEGLPDITQRCLRYVENDGQVASAYPANPNGSPEGITGLCNRDGRITIMMPHPERLLRQLNFSWAPSEWGEVSPWQRMFDNARKWCGEY